MQRHLASHLPPASFQTFALHSGRFVASLLTLLFAFLALGAGHAADQKPIEFFLVVTGGELLQGVYPDSHTSYLTRALRPLGVRCVGSLLVDDQRDDIHRALRYATNRAPLVIVTGGLGPTANDITRETLSDFTGIPLREDQDVVRDMERRFGQPRERLRANLQRQALVPAQGRYLKNSGGTAVGLVFEAAPSVIVALPGPPRELQAIAREELVPFLRERFGVRELGCSLQLRFVGAGQSLIDQTLKDHVPLPADMVVTSLFEAGRVDFTFSLPGNTDDDRQQLEAIEKSLRRHLSEYIYANDSSSLEDVVVKKLRARGGALVLVDIGSGGAVATALHGAREAASLLAGAFVAHSEPAAAELLGLEAERLGTGALDRVKMLASTAAAKTRSPWALVVGAVHAVRPREHAVWIACHFPDDHWETELLPVRNPSESPRPTLTTPVMDFLRRRLP